MTVSKDCAVALDAFQDARNATDVITREHLLGLADVLATQADHLVHAYDELQTDYENTLGRECPEPIVHELDDVSGLAGLVREDHDVNHDEPFTICSHQTCRLAARLRQ